MSEATKGLTYAQTLALALRELHTAEETVYAALRKGRNGEDDINEDSGRQVVKTTEYLRNAYGVLKLAAEMAAQEEEAEAERKRMEAEEIESEADSLRVRMLHVCSLLERAEAVSDLAIDEFSEDIRIRQDGLDAAYGAAKLVRRALDELHKNLEFGSFEPREPEMEE